MSNEKIEVEISPQTNKLLQAYIAVNDNDSHDDVVSQLNEHIETSLKNFLVKKTLESLRDSHGDILYSFAKENYGVSIIEEVASAVHNDEYSMASLSSEVDHEWKKTGGITDEDLARDMKVEDPEHEAAAEALQEDIANEEDMMVVLSGENKAVEIPANSQKNNPFEERRKKRIITKGKVSKSTSGVDTDIQGGTVS